MAEARRTHSGPGWKREAVVAALAGLLISSWSPVSAAEKERRKIPVTINKGETYVIADVSQKENAPGVKVAANPNALVVQNAPGKIVLVGADAGSWKLDVTLASGEKVTYEVSVKALGPPQGSLAFRQVPVWSAGETNVASRHVAEKVGFVEVARWTYVIPEEP